MPAVATGRGADGKGAKGQRESLTAGNAFVLIMVIVTKVSTFVKTHQTAPPK